MSAGEARSFIAPDERVQIMSEARWGKRYEQRLEATYGIESYDEKGYVYDIAPFGLFLNGDRFYQPDTQVEG